MSPTQSHHVINRSQLDSGAAAQRELSVEKMQVSDRDRAEAIVDNRVPHTELVDEKANRILAGAFDKVSSRTATIAGEGSTTTIRGGGSIADVEAHAREVATVAIGESGIDHSHQGAILRKVTDEAAYRAKAAQGSAETEKLKREQEPKTEVAGASAEGRSTATPNGQPEKRGHGQGEAIPGGETEVAGLSEEQQAIQRGKILAAGVKGQTALTTGTTTGTEQGVGGTISVVAGVASPILTSTVSEGLSTDPSSTAKPETLAEKRARIAASYDKLVAQLESRGENDLALN